MARPTLIVMAAVERAGSRARELQSKLKGVTADKVTMAAGVTNDSALVIGTSEANGYLRPGVVDCVTEDEKVATGSEHAEQNIVAHSGTALVAVGAGRDICAACEEQVVSVGAVPATSCKSGKRYVG